MRETRFIHQNREKWDEFEKILRDGQKDPEKITRLFVEITEDLSYAHTFYPHRTVRQYLNRTAQYVYNRVNRNRIFRWTSFWNFWADELPWVIYSSRRQLILSFLIFAVSMSMGMLISAYDPQFTATILGKDYVEMTVRNIQKGDPMAVYKDPDATGMFLGITLNNIKVAFIIFISGLLIGIGAIYVLIFNALMIGSFQYFFYERGVLADALITIWQHGTIEVASIILAGAAGITLGQGLVFPGAYTRGDSFRISAYRAIKIFLGTVPLFIIAGFIEGFITRLTDAPWLLRLLMIASSLFFMLFYFVWLPFRKHRTKPSWGYPPEKIPPHHPFRLRTGILPNGAIIKESFSFLRQNLSKLSTISLSGGVALIVLFAALYRTNMDAVFRFPGFRSFVPATPFLYVRDLFAVFNPLEFPWLMLLMTGLVAWIICVTLSSFSRLLPHPSGNNGVLNYLKVFGMVILAFIPFFFNRYPMVTLGLLILQAPFLLLWVINIFLHADKPVRTAWWLTRKYYFRVLWMLLSAGFISFLIMMIFATPVMYIYIEFVTQHIPPGQVSPAMFYVGYLLLTGFAGISLLFPFVLICIAYKKGALDEMESASSLIDWFRKMGEERRAYGFKAEA